MILRIVNKARGQRRGLERQRRLPGRDYEVAMLARSKNVSRSRAVSMLLRAAKTSTVRERAISDRWQ